MGIKLYTDGGFDSANNQIAVGIMIKKGDKIITKYGKKLKARGTNNEAEYHALIVGLRECIKRAFDEIEVNMDSQLVVRQMSGQYMVRSAKLSKLQQKAKKLADKFKSISFVWLPRTTKEIRIVDKLNEKAKTCQE